MGDEFTIVDIATYLWVRSYPWAKVSIDGLDKVQAWCDRIDARPKPLPFPSPFPPFLAKVMNPPPKQKMRPDSRP